MRNYLIKKSLDCNFCLFCFILFFNHIWANGSWDFCEARMKKNRGWFFSRGILLTVVLCFEWFINFLGKSMKILFLIFSMIRVFVRTALTSLNREIFMLITKLQHPPEVKEIPNTPLIINLQSNRSFYPLNRLQNVYLYFNLFTESLCFYFAFIISLGWKRRW